MKIVDFSVRRPVTVFMIILIVVFLGIFSYSQLAIDLMPDITYPRLTIQTEYEGVSPQEIETLITRPIEEVAASIEGIDEMTSSSQEGRSVVQISFKWGKDLEEVANDLRAKLDRIVNILPEEADKPILYKFDLNAIPIMWLGVSGDMSRVRLRVVAEKELKNRLERIEGVAQITIVGGLEREIHVEVRYKDLQAKNVSMNDVANALKSENVDLAVGDFRDKNRKYLIRTIGRFKTIDEINHVLIKRINGVSITVSDIADVIDKYKDIQTVVRVNGNNALLFRVVKQPDANTILVAEKLREEIKKIQNDPSVKVNLAITRDVSTYIKRAISNVQRAAFFGGIIAIIVLVLFLRNVRSTFIIASAMVVSLIATFIFIKGAGFTLNMMSFGGLALGIGMLVDNSVVVIENIFRHRSEAKNSIDAALIGTTEVSNAITVSTITTAIVFLPLFFFKGTTGVMFSQLAYMVSFSLFASLIVALTIIPAFSSRFIKTKNEGVSNTLRTMEKVIGRFFDRLEESYTQTLIKFLKHKTSVILGFVVLTVLVALLLKFMAFDYMPVTDEGEVGVNGELAVGTNIETTDLKFKKLEKMLLKKYGKDIETLYTRIGRASYRRLSERAGYMNIILKPFEVRKRTSSQIAKEIRKTFSKEKGVRLRVRQRSFFIFRILRGGEDRISLELRGHDLKKGDELAQKIMRRLSKIKGITDLRQSREYGNPEYSIRIDRRKAREMGLSVSELSEFLQTAILGKVATRFSDGEYEYDILVRLKPGDIKDINAIKDLVYPIDKDNKVILKNLIDVTPTFGPMIIERLNQQRVIYIRGGIGDRATKAVLDDIKKSISAIDFPEFFYIRYGGIFEEQEKAYSDLLMGIILAVCLVYMVMAAQFESFKAPFVIMFTVPFSFAGVILIFYITDVSFDVQGFIGTIMLTGIVVNNSIVLVDFIQRLSKNPDISTVDAIIEAGSKRLRPILMTSLTTILALIPLAIGIGEGSELQKPMALSVIGGLSYSTFISLFLIPCIYLLFFKKKSKVV